MLEDESRQPLVREYTVEPVLADVDPFPGELWARLLQGPGSGRLQRNVLEIPYSARHMTGRPGSAEVWIEAEGWWCPTLRLFVDEDLSFLTVPLYPVQQVVGQVRQLGEAKLPDQLVIQFEQAELVGGMNATEAATWPAVPRSNLRCPVSATGTFLCELPATTLEVAFCRDPGPEEKAELPAKRVRQERLVNCAAGPPRLLTGEASAQPVDLGRIQLP
ncbi:MAG: hypothetical protein AAGD01_15150 [Acidobacteriota bacterium]